MLDKEGFMFQNLILLILFLSSFCGYNIIEIMTENYI